MLGSDVAHLVALLKEPPFELHHLTGPRLGELGGEETRRLAVDVFSKLSPPGAFQGSATGGTLAEEGERTTAKLLEFLRHVKYRPEGGDESAQRKAWQLGDHDVVLPALKWVLDHRERCEKRAYVGHFMADYAVPGEYAMDPEIQDLMNNTHELQRAFVEAHKECEQARREAKDPVKLKSQIADLEREREQVRRRIDVTKGKVAQRVMDPRELDELVALAQSLREEQEQEHELARQTRDQTERRDLADRRRNRAATRIRELRTSLASGSPAALLQQLADEVNARKQLVEEKLPADLAKKRARLTAVREILRSDVRTDSDIAAQTSEVNKLSAEVRELEDELSEAMAKRDDDVQLRQQAQVAKTIAAKRASAVAKRDRLAQRRNQVVGEYESASARQEGDGSAPGDAPGGRAATDPDEMKARFESVKAKLAKYKSLKRELDELNMEAAVLARTEAILEEDARGVMGDVAEEERRAGVAGFAQAQETLEHVSKVKGDVDSAKGAALEEINAYVAEITRKIKERKGALQPKIKELRDLRQHFGALESKHADAKKRYDVEAAKHQKKRDALESEVNQLRTQVLGDETKYHRMNIESALVEAHAKRATGGDARRYDAMYRAAVDETDNETKRLNERTEEVRNNFSQGVEAVEALKDLYRILDVKLRVTRRDMAGESLGQTTTYGGANVLSM